MAQSFTIGTRDAQKFVTVRMQAIFKLLSQYQEAVLYYNF